MTLPQYSAGFQTQRQEIDDVLLPSTGAVPPWLQGTMVRNGPAMFEFGDEPLRHWFDGMAKLHRFSFSEGLIRYGCKFVESEAMRRNREAGRLVSREFGTNPPMSLWARARSILALDTTDNANVNVACIGENFLALTEPPSPTRFDLETSATIGRFTYGDRLAGQVSTAHPQLDVTSGAIYNLLIQMGPQSKYQIYRIDAGSTTRKVVAAIPVKEPGYIHSFALTRRFIVLVEFPFVVNPLELVLSGKPYIENFRWKPDRGMRGFVVDKETGEVTRRFSGGPCFAFHHVNAFEDGDDLVIDMTAYEDAAIIKALYLENLLDVNGLIPPAALHRYRLAPNRKEAEREVLSDRNFELPRINYRTCNGAGYRYCWGLGQTAPVGFLDCVNKLDTVGGSVRSWRRDGLYPGEPVFVAKPGGVAEDDGVLLSVVLDAPGSRSLLSILDAASMDELASAIIPHVVPFGFHGQFFGSDRGTG